VGVRAVDRVLVAIAEGDQRVAQIERGRGQDRDELAVPHPVHRHVDVVAAARGVQTAGNVLAARTNQEALDVEEQILARAVVGRALDGLDRDAVECRADRARVGRGNDAAVGEHDEMCVVNRQERRQEQRLRILEVLVEDLRNVFRIEPHRLEYSAVAYPFTQL